MSGTDLANRDGSPVWVKGANNYLGVTALIDLSAIGIATISEYNESGSIRCFSKNSPASVILQHYETIAEAVAGLELLYQYLRGDITIHEWKQKRW